MRLARRHLIAVIILLAVMAATSAVFAFARPIAHSPYETVIDFSKQRYYSPEAVRYAFAQNRIKLYAGDPPAPAAAWYASNRLFSATAVQVMVAPRRGRGSWGPKLARYDVRFGNVFVSYGGHDAALLARVRRTIAQLR